MKADFDHIVDLLKRLIETPSFSRQEKGTADILVDFLKRNHIEVNRLENNVWAYNKHFDPAKKTILLNSHHDTVKDSVGWTTDPFTPFEADSKIVGLGSNDAGASLVSLAAVFNILL